ncbi:MAG: hypothetical protein RBS01_02925 [Candidatus Dojkabacteria bacterium]|jgi:hypothetical protein|nr:hypothetical protein [Candidatus Dojkabacteria bacterium]
MRKILLSFVLLLLSIDTALADFYFSNDGDITYNRYFDTLGYGIGELLESEKCPNCVEYDTSKVSGTSSSWILSNINISDVTEDDWRYGLVRNWDVYDRVSLPPYSSLDFIYWSENRAGEDVNVTSLKVLLSKQDIANGDLREVLYIDGEYQSIPVKYIIYNYPRDGIVKTYPGVGVVNTQGGFTNGMILDRVYVKPALQFIKWEAQRDEESVLVRVYVKNDSDIILRDTVFTHGQYSLARDFAPKQEYIYEYVLEVGESLNLGYAGIYDPNEYQQCAVKGEHMESNYVGESVIVAGVREENGQYLSYIGSRVKPYMDSFCVTRIPYTLYSGEIVLEGKKDDVIEEEVLIEESMGEVLGVKKLPQTSINMFPFLVVFPLLWYYLLRRLTK